MIWTLMTLNLIWLWFYQ